MGAADKAELFKKTFAAKQYLPEAVVNEYSTLLHGPCRQDALGSVTAERVKEVLEALRVDSATGPDLLPTRVLKQCAGALAAPVAGLAQRILKSGVWPQKWMEHWVAPVFKKKSVFNPLNYRGVHITSQLSKVMERVILELLTPFLEDAGAFGEHQFAYRKGHGARDALAVMSLTWIHSMNERKKTAVYCSDVSGAFDRVATPRLVQKLRASGMHESLVAMFSSWLQQRAAFLVVEGKKSEAMALENMVFQGTVFGPTLWNLFFADANRAIRRAGFLEVVYADDLNAHKQFDGEAENSSILDEASQCQDELHRWGVANQVSFDPAKGSVHIISHIDPCGAPFRILGVKFDCKLTMATAVQELVVELRWKLRTLLRATRFFSIAEQVLQYKARLLSYIEYRTPALYHACQSHLGRLDAVQRSFLKEVGLSDTDALLRFNLAPLSSRRDMAMLGVIHRAVLGLGPKQLHKFSKCKFLSLFHHAHGGLVVGMASSWSNSGLLTNCAF